MNPEPKPSFLGDLALLRDRVTELMSAVGESQRSEAILCAVAAATQGLLNDAASRDAIQHAIALVGEAAGAERITVLERVRGPDPERELLTFRHRWVAGEASPDLPAIDTPVDFGGGPWRLDLLAGRCVRLTAADMERAGRELVERAGVRSFLVAPIPVEGETWGFISFLAASDDRVWTASEESILRTVSVSIGNAIGRTRAEASRIAVERRLQESEKLRSLALLAKGVAHDVNNFLMVIRGRVEMVGAAGSNVDAIQTALERIQQLIRQLSLYAGGQIADRSSVKVHDLVRRTASGLRESMPAAIALDLGDVFPVPEVRVDATHLVQVVTNLISNARDAIGDRAGRIALATSEVRLSRDALEAALAAENAQPGRFVLIEVADDGHGMTERVRARVFDPFFTTKPEGHGFGLSTTLGFVRAHAGALTVESSRGRGARFRIWLPVAPAGAADGAEAGAVS